MALREILANFAIRVDVTQLTAANARIDAMMARLGAMGLEVPAALQQTIASLDQIANAATAEAAAIEEAAGAHTDLTAALNEALGAQGAMAPAVEESVTWYDKLKAAASSAADSVKSGFGSLRDAMKIPAKQAAGEVGMVDGALNNLKGVLLPLAGFAGIKSLIMDPINQADQIDELAERLGVSTDNLQTWQFMAKKVGVEGDNLGMVFKTLSGGISSGSKEIKALGLTPKDLENGDFADRLETVGKAIVEKYTDPMKQAAVANTLLGREGAKLLPLFRNGAAAFDAQKASAKELAVVYSAELAKSAGDLNDELDVASLQFQKVRAGILMAVLPALRSVVSWATPLISRLGAIFKASRVLETALIGLGAAGFGMLITRAGGFLNLLKTGGRFVLRFLLPFLVLEDIITFLTGGESALGDFLNAIFGAGTAKGVLDTLKAAFEGVVGAAEWLWGTVTGDDEAVAAGVQKLTNFTEWGKAVLSDFGFFFSDLWNNQLPGWAQAGLIALLTVVTGGLAGIFFAWQAWGDQIMAWVSGVADGIANAISSGIDRARNAVAGFAANIPLIGDSLKGAIEVTKDAGAAPPAVGSNNTVNINDNSTFSTSISGVQNGGQAATAVREGHTQIRDTVGKTRGATFDQLGGQR